MWEMPLKSFSSPSETPHHVMGLGFPPPAVATSEISTAQPQLPDPSARGFPTASPGLVGWDGAPGCGRGRLSLGFSEAAARKPPFDEAEDSCLCRGCGKVPSHQLCRQAAFQRAGSLAVAGSIYLLLLRNVLTVFKPCLFSSWRSHALYCHSSWSICCSPLLT